MHYPNLGFVEKLVFIKGLKQEAHLPGLIVLLIILLHDLLLMEIQPSSQGTVFLLFFKIIHAI